MSARNVLKWLVVLAVALLHLPAVHGQTADRDLCVYCGAPATCRVCRLACETKKVPEMVFSCECEDFCVPGRSQIECETDIDENGCEQQKTVWIPVAKEIRSRKVLKKSTQEKETTVRKLVVQKVCAACACDPYLTLPEKDDDKKAEEKKGDDKKQPDAKGTPTESAAPKSQTDGVDQPPRPAEKLNFSDFANPQSPPQTSRRSVESPRR